ATAPETLTLRSWRVPIPCEIRHPQPVPDPAVQTGLLGCCANNRCERPGQRGKEQWTCLGQCAEERTHRAIEGDDDACPRLVAGHPEYPSRQIDIPPGLGAQLAEPY